jgi:hypothetical protein
MKGLVLAHSPGRMRAAIRTHARERKKGEREDAMSFIPNGLVKRIRWSMGLSQGNTAGTRAPYTHGMLGSLNGGDALYWLTH